MKVRSGLLRKQDTGRRSDQRPYLARERRLVSAWDAQHPARAGRLHRTTGGGGEPSRRGELHRKRRPHAGERCDLAEHACRDRTGLRLHLPVDGHTTHGELRHA
ncbi:MAG: hypothetical protein U0Y82_16200 [Thermoleophilia bacterium]